MELAGWLGGATTGCNPLRNRHTCIPPPTHKHAAHAPHPQLRVSHPPRGSFGSTVLLVAAMAASASSRLEKERKPKPLLLPSGLRSSVSSRMVPNWAKWGRRSYSSRS